MTSASTGDTTDGAATQSATDAAPPPRKSAFDLEQDLHDALSFAPLDSTFIGYTHWGRIAEYAGVDLNQQDARTDLMSAVLRNPAPAHALRADFQAVFDAYGIDQTRLVWEANYGGPSAPWTAMKLRESVDVAELVAAFERKEFAVEDSGNLVELTHDYDLSLPGAAEGMDNVAILREERIMIFGPPEINAEAVEAYTQGESVDDYALPAGMVEAVEAVSGASIHLTGCTPTGPSDVRGRPDYTSLRTEVQEQLRSVGGVQPFLGALFAYDRELGHARGHLVLVYETPGGAQDDVKARTELARVGKTTDELFAELFTLDDVRADGPYLTLTFGFPEDDPDKLLGLSLGVEPFSVAAC